MTDIMLVMPRTAVKVSQPLTKRSCNIVKNVKGISLVANSVINCWESRKIENVLRTHGTFNLCHSFSSKAERP